MVRDGHTIVIGGLFRESTHDQQAQVPGLGSLPGVGPLFRKQTDSTVREEVIILLTPHIMKDEPAYAERREEELKDAERLRVGMRKGMMPWGRERLAETSYEKAVEELNKPNPDTPEGAVVPRLRDEPEPQVLRGDRAEGARPAAARSPTSTTARSRHFVRRPDPPERAHPASDAGDGAEPDAPVGRAGGDRCPPRRRARRSDDRVQRRSPS